MGNTKSSKAKGRRLQNYVRDKLRELFVLRLKVLEDSDIKSQIMGVNGEDIELSASARKYIPLSIECKNQEKLNIWKAMEQAEANTPKNDKGLDITPTVVFKRNRTDAYVTIPFKDFLRIIELQTIK